MRGNPKGPVSWGKVILTEWWSLPMDSSTWKHPKAKVSQKGGSLSWGVVVLLFFVCVCVCVVVVVICLPASS